MSKLFGGGGTVKPPSGDDSEAREQRRRRAIADSNRKGRASTILGNPLGTSDAGPKRKTALGG